MFDFKNNPHVSEFRYSDLTDEDLTTISDAEQKISKHLNSNQVLIAYDRAEGTGQSGARS